MADAGNHSGEKISTIEQLMARLASLGDGDFVYRGQADAKWRLKSGAVRRVQSKRQVNTSKYPEAADVSDYVLELANNARSLGLEFHGGTRGNCCDLKVLAELQHHGAATNLLDFSRNILVALWMVCSEQFDQDGKIFVANLLDDEFEELSVTEAEKITIPELFKKSKIQVWIPERFFVRIQSQSSVFLITPDESQINCHEILVDKNSKKELLRILAGRFSLTEVQVYPDLPGFARANRAEMPCYNRHENYYIRKAEKLAENGSEEEAQRFFKKAKNVAPKNYNVFFKSGLFWDLHGHWDCAIKDYNKAIRLNPIYSNAYNNRGNLQQTCGKLTEAKKDYDKAIELNPNYASAYYNRGLLRSGQGNHKEAKEDYDKAIELNPNYSPIYNNRGKLKLGQGDLKGAREDFDKAIEINQYSSKAYNNRGVLRRRQDDSEGAREDFDKAIKLNPNYANAYNNRGNLKKDQGDLVGARTDYDKAIELNPNNADAYHNRGILRDEQGDSIGARTDCDKAIKLNPNNADFYLSKTLVLNGMGENCEAIESCKEYIRLQPDDPRGPELLAKLEKKLKG